MKVLFMGTPEFAKISLEYLVKNKYNIAGVVTQPDKPAGRKMILTPSPVKEYASGENIPVYQPQSLKGEDFFDLLKSIYDLRHIIFKLRIAIMYNSMQQ
ncbi:MAG: hypothetical protein LBT06_10675 [Hungatella sp.]|jgi:methionyl-tRNA formyltransferase|nr:hypothetical protein [Hungatella sp.]